MVTTKSAQTQTPNANPILDGLVYEGQLTSFGRQGSAARIAIKKNVRVCGCLAPFFERSLTGEYKSARTVKFVRFTGHQFTLPQLQATLAEINPTFGFSGVEIISFVAKLSPSGNLFEKTDGDAQLRYIIPVRMVEESSAVTWIVVKYSGEDERWDIYQLEEKTISGGYGGVGFSEEAEKSKD